MGYFRKVILNKTTVVLIIGIIIAIALLFLAIYIYTVAIREPVEHTGIVVDKIYEESYEVNKRKLTGMIMYMPVYRNYTETVPEKFIIIVYDYTDKDLDSFEVTEEEYNSMNIKDRVEWII